MPDTREAIKTDLIAIAKLNTIIDYNDHDSLVRACRVIETKAPFRSVYGKRFYERLKQMLGGDDFPHVCITCNKPVEGRMPMCRACEEALTKGMGDTQPKPTPGTDNPAPVAGQAFKPASAPDIGSSEKAEAAPGGENPFTRIDLQGIADLVREKASPIRSGISGLWKKLGQKRQIILVAAAAAVLVLILVIVNLSRGSSGGGGGKGSPGAETSDRAAENILSSGSGYELDPGGSEKSVIDDENGAEKLLLQLFPGEDGWAVRSVSESKWSAGYFWTPVGRSHKYAEEAVQAIANEMTQDRNTKEAQELIRSFYQTEKCYSGFIQNKKNGDYALVVVSPSGRLFRTAFPSEAVHDAVGEEVYFRAR